MSVKKTCSNCGREVSSSSKSGETCPHCGAYWSHESDYKPASAYEPSEESIRRKLWEEISNRIGDKIPQIEKDALADLAKEGRIQYLDKFTEDEHFFLIEDGHVTVLNIYILNEFYETLFNLKGLKIFNIHTGIPSIPDRMDEFVELTEMSLIFTSLKEFPESFGRMPKLTSLLIQYGSIPKFPPNFGKTSKLRELTIDTPDESIANISSVLGKIPSLEILKLKWVYLNFLPDNMRNHQNLVALAVHDNQGPLELEDGFCELTNLSMFNSYKTPLENLSKEAKTFIKGLKKRHGFSKKDLWEEISLSTLK